MPAFAGMTGSKQSRYPNRIWPTPVRGNESGAAKFKGAARATAIKNRRVNIRLSSGDLRDIQVKALEEGVPYETLIASVLHKYVTGRLAGRLGRVTNAPRKPAAKRRTSTSG